MRATEESTGEQWFLTPFSIPAPLVISIETRKEVGEDYSALRGFFRQFELYYVVSDERDLIRLRTNFRGEDVYLYRLRAPPARARSLLLDYLREQKRCQEPFSRRVAGSWRIWLLRSVACVWFDERERTDRPAHQIDRL